jgi:hypothetical protein
MIFSKCTGLGDGQHGARGEEYPGALQQLQASQEQPQGTIAIVADPRYCGTEMDPDPYL